MTTQTNQLKLLTINQFVENHSFATHGGLRHLIFNATNNGFHKVIKRIGKRVLIDENQFFAWVESQNEGAGNV
jgi:hypothetical protein